MIWPKTVGKSLEDYQEEASPALNLEGFTNEIRAYLRTQGTAEELASETINTLFGITLRFLKDRMAVSKMKEAQIEQDWNTRKHLISSLKKHVASIRLGAHRRRKMLRRPLTCLLADSVLRKTNSLAEELDRVAQFQRLQVSMFGALRNSTRGIKVYEWDINNYLKEKFPHMKQRERDLIIAGTMIASKLKTDDPHRELAANVAMARSRGKHTAKDEGHFLEWVREAAPQGKLKGRRKKS